MKSKILKIKCALLLFLLVLPLTSKAANAQNQNTNNAIKNIFSVSPIIIDTRLEKDKTQTFEINIRNEMGTPLGIGAQVQNFYSSDNGVFSDRSSKLLK